MGQESIDQYGATLDVISFEELTDHGLFDPGANSAEQQAALDWLAERLRQG